MFHLNLKKNSLVAQHVQYLVLFSCVVVMQLTIHSSTQCFENSVGDGSLMVHGERPLSLSQVTGKVKNTKTTN